MKLYILSIVVGVLVGVVYSLLGVRSPAPPVVALLGLLGMLVGEQLMPLATRVWRRELFVSSSEQVVIPQLFRGKPSGRKSARLAEAEVAAADKTDTHFRP